MASLKDIRRRIGSVKNTQQITNAMKMIAAVKLRKAQDQILAARPYAQELLEVISNLALHVEGGEGRHHPLLVQRRPNRVRLIVVTSDRGLCGSYNSNIIRRAEKFLHEKKDSFRELKVSFIGRKGHEYFKKRLSSDVLDKFYSDVISRPSFEKTAAIANEVLEEFLKENLDHVYFIYNEFKSALTQKVVLETLLPTKPSMEVSPREVLSNFQKVDYLYEPSRKEVLSALLPKHVLIQVYRILLEAISSEHGARMTSMDSATSNAGEMISKLTLQANRVRQAAITTELMEIVSGAEALRA